MSGNKKPHNSYYAQLTRKMVLTVIIVSFAPMILVIAVILHQFQISYHEKIYAHWEELVEKHKQNIDSFLKEKLGDIRFLSETARFDNLKQEDFLRKMLATLQEEFAPVFVDLGVVTEAGRQIAYAGPFKLAEAQYAEAEWFKSAIQTDYFISDVFLGLRGLPHFIIAVRHKWKGKFWILRATIDFIAFNNLVENIRIGKTGFAFILNKNAEFQTKPGVDIDIDCGPYKDLLENGKKNEDTIYVSEVMDDCQKKNIYVSTFLKSGTWMLVYQQNKAEAFSDFYQARRTAIAIFLLGGLCIITMAILLSGRIVRLIAKADREKQMMNQQVIETGKLASIGELAAGIAHEINNPVAIMVEEAGWIQDLLEEEEFTDGENLEEFHRALKQINTQGKRCKEITYKLLSFARKTDSRLQVIQLNDLIEEVVSLSAQRAKYSQVNFQTVLKKALPPVEGSKTEIQQVLLNLINNALDAMEPKGGVLDITSRVDGGGIVIDITDNGPGIPEANLARIFDPFFTTKPVGKGTGLGLSICYGIINKMGGKVDVHSVIDHGTVFSIRLPFLKEGETEIEKLNETKS
jgi:two-component system, NtrC family, sensor kinase